MNKIKKCLLVLMSTFMLSGCCLFQWAHSLNREEKTFNEEETPSSFVTKLTNPYVSDVEGMKDRLSIGYQFQNTSVKVGDYTTIGWLKIFVYDEDNMVLGFEVIDAQYYTHHKLEAGEYDMVLGQTEIKLRRVPKDGEKLRIVGEASVNIDGERSNINTTVEYTVHREK